VRLKTRLIHDTFNWTHRSHLSFWARRRQFNSQSAAVKCYQHDESASSPRWTERCYQHSRRPVAASADEPGRHTSHRRRCDDEVGTAKYTTSRCSSPTQNATYRQNKQQHDNNQ